MKFSRVLLLFMAIVPVGMVVVAVVRHRLSPRQEAHASAKSEFQQVTPAIAAKVENTVSNLQSESVKESLAKLSDVNLFFWPGPSPGGGGAGTEPFVPLPAKYGRRDLDAIMSNRRFLKAIGDLQGLSKEAMTAEVKRELAAGLAECLPLYDAELNNNRQDLTLRRTNASSSFVAPALATGNVPEGQVVIMGARLKVLTLVWVSGLLELSGCREQVNQVARVGIRQKTELYNDSTFHPFVIAMILNNASLYNRQILASGLIGTETNSELRTAALRASGATWVEKQLTPYKAAVTEFDVPAVTGIISADYSLGRQKVSFLSPLSDASFDKLLWELHLAQ
jgi:hypothetical protein